MAQINKRFGENTVVMGGDISTDGPDRTSNDWTATTFDYILGGGFADKPMERTRW
jgi:subtilase family serine protease